MNSWISCACDESLKATTSEGRCVMSIKNKHPGPRPRMQAGSIRSRIDLLPQVIWFKEVLHALILCEDLPENGCTRSTTPDNKSYRESLTLQPRHVALNPRLTAKFE
jgi:hypothetical protein